jgi:diguanylate cyclase (GGDEF)-like protein
LGGDEFAIILRHCDPGESVVIAGKVLSAIAALEIVEAGRTFRVTASLGLRPLASTGVPLPPAAQLLREADQASYAAKRQGGNQLVMAAYQ